MSYDVDYYSRLVKEFKKSKEAIEALTKRQSSMRDELVNFLTENGYEDEKGHLRIDLPDANLKYERRVSRSFNKEAAESWAKDQGIWDLVSEVVELISEDKLLGYAWLHEEVEEAVQSFYSEKESWALKT